MNTNNEAIVRYSPTPTFNLITGTTQVITLTGDAVPSIVNPSNTIYTFVIIQDDIGGHSFSWPSNFRGAGSVNPTNGTADTNTIAIQSFAYMSFLDEFVATTTMSYGI